MKYLTYMKKTGTHPQWIIEKCESYIKEIRKGIAMDFLDPGYLLEKANKILEFTKELMENDD